MTTSSGRKHAGPGPASDQPPVPEPTFAERARTLVYLGRVGSLSTLSRKQPGFPFGSVMPYGLDDHGRPIFLISTMAMHTQNLQADARASLLVTQEDTDGEPLGASRVTLVGNVLPVPNTELAEVRKLYLERHANSKYWVDFEDFSFYRMDVVDVYYVGGFGVMGWVSASDYDRSQPDPLADSMAEIIQHMNADHKDALVLLARQFAHLDSTEVDLGILSWHPVPKYLELLTRIRERDFENLIHEVVISIQFVQGLFEHFQLKIKIHPYRTIKAYQPGMDGNIGVLSFGTRCIAGTAKIDAVSGDERPVAIDDEAF